MADIGSYESDEEYPRDPLAQLQPPPGAQAQPAAAPPAPPRPPQPAQPQVPELPWGPSDQAELSRLQNSLSQIEKDQAAGVITPEVGQQAQAQIAPRLQKLQAKQQKQMAQAAQQAQKQMMEGMAQQESIETVHRARRASDFPKTVAKYEDLDPLTGEVKTAHFFQDTKGNWKQIEFPERPEVFNSADVGLTPSAAAAAAEPPILPATGSNPPSSILAAEPNSSETQRHSALLKSLGIVPDAQPGPMGPQQSEAGTSEPPVQTLEQFGAQQRQQAQQAAQAPQVDPATFEQTVRSGPYTDVYRGGRLVSSDRPPPETAQGGQSGMITPAAIKKAFELAEKYVPQLPAGANEHMQLHRLQTVHNIAERILSRQMLDYQYQLNQQAAVAEHLRQEQARSSEAQRREQSLVAERLRQEDVKKQEQQRRAAHGGLSDAQLSQLRSRIETQVRSERKQALKERAAAGQEGAAVLPNSPSPSGLPPALLESNQQQEVERRLQEHLDHLRALHGEAAPAAPAAPQQPAAPAAKTRSAPQAQPQNVQQPSPEQLQQPSKEIDVRRVQELRVALQQALEKEPRTNASEIPGLRPSSSDPFVILSKMEQTLRAAYHGLRRPTLGERKQYDELWQQLPEGQLKRDLRSRAYPEE